MGVKRRPVDNEGDLLDKEYEDEAPAVMKDNPPTVYNDSDDDGLDAEDEDEQTGRSDAVLTGAAGAKRTRQLGSEYANEFKFEKGKKSLIAFLEDESFASYRQHWVERKGKKSFICIGKGCPLCGAGDRASGKYAFNIYDYDQKEVKALIAGPVLLEVLEDAAEESKTGKLSDGYWAISRSGQKSKTSYGCNQVKERDLEEDFGITPSAAAAALIDAVPYKPSIFLVPKLDELRRIAKEFTEDDVADDD